MVGLDEQVVVGCVGRSVHQQRVGTGAGASPKHGERRRSLDFTVQVDVVVTFQSAELVAFHICTAQIDLRSHCPLQVDVNRVGGRERHVDDVRVVGAE